jgi:ABC-2 type transport system ATP-binding protein
VLHHPSIVMLDEPTSGVDPHARRMFWDLIYSLSRNSGVTVLVSTHYMDEAAHCDRLGLMHQGRLIAEGAPSDLKARSERRSGILLAIEAADTQKAYRALVRERPQAVLYGDRIHVRSTDPEADAIALAELFEREGTGRVRIAPATLSMDEAFIDLIQAAETAHA